MKRIILTLLISLFCIASSVSTFAKPNIVVFLADDAGWGDYSANGNTNVRTPNIDSLAHDGVRFDRFFVCAVCSPTRAEFLTGRYHPRGGVRGVSTGQERLNLDEKTIADAFKTAGYATGAFGKWHNGSQWPYHPMARGFDEYYGHTSGHWGEYFDPPLEHNGRMIRDKGYIVDLCTDRALDFIDRNRARPFFCFIPFTTPHSPWAAPDQNWQQFKNKALPLRATNPEQEELDHTRCALAMLENQDWNVGRVLRKLDQHSLRENTVVLYFSDNGPNSWRWNGGMKGRKGSVDEGGIRSLLFVRWPGQVQPGRTISQIAGAIDLLPTLASLAGISPPADKPLDGLNLAPLLKTTDVAWPERTLFSHWNGRTSVRTQQYRLDGSGALFDMTADPGQQHDIAGNHPAIVAQLSNAIAKWHSDVFGSARSASSRPIQRPSKTPGLPPDDRPFPVGFSDFPWTPLPARDGVPHGGIRRSSAAPNCSYFVNWKNQTDSITWDIEVSTSGNYEIVIDYTCPLSDAGSVIELSFNQSKIEGTVAPGWDPPLYTHQDTVKRPGAESQMKEFRPLRLGTVHLEKGRGLLTLRALTIPGKYVMDLRRLNLIFVK